MESKLKGIAWVGNIYQKFEAMCSEVEEIMCQEKLRCIENLQTVGSNVKQFCTEFVQEVLPSSPSNSVHEHGLNSSQTQDASVTAYENPDISGEEDQYQKEEIHSQKEESHSSSVESVENESDLARCSVSTPSGSVILTQACKNQLEDIDSTLDETSLESTEVASDKSATKAEVEAVLLPWFNDKVKLEESCIIVDSSELQSLSNEAGEHKSYKKKLREAFSSKSRLTKQDDEQPAGRSVEVEPYSKMDKYESQDMEFSDSEWELI